MTDDDPVRGLFAPLQDCTTPRADADALAAAVRARRRRRAGPVAATLAITGAIAMATAALPGEDAATRSERPAGAAALLRGAAAVAAERPSLAPGDGYRYERRRIRRTAVLRQGDHEAAVRIEGVIEHWENAELEGRQVQHPERIVSISGDQALERELRSAFVRRESMTISAEMANGGLGPLPELERLPEDPEAMRAALERHVRTSSHWRPGALTEALMRSLVLGHTKRLLTTAAAAPSVRSTAFLVLSRLPGVTSLGRRTIAGGRVGEAFAVENPGDGKSHPPSRGEVVFDPETTELIESSHATESPLPGRGVVRHTRRAVVEESGQVASIGARP